MSKNLVIVESPAKAKTIEGFLGEGYTVKSSFGHIRDLVKEKNGVDINNNFEPSYEVSADKKDIIKELKKLADAAETVWLASDEDREGEAISWHLKEALKLKNDKIKRIVFHEITKPAILKAIDNPRAIDDDMVDAQQARRVLDRLVGFELSPLLWKKVKPSLSAGRVQSVCVRLIVEREREIQNHQSEYTFKVTANFVLDGNVILKSEHSGKPFAQKEQANAFLTTCLNAIFSIKSLETKPATKSPAAPFTTSTLQQEASRKLGFSVSRTMSVAQKLYEAGKITYMRTDSTNLSQTALDAAKTEIESAYGKPYSHTRQYKTKAAGAQEAHEAIRPTYFENHTTEGERDEKVLYDLIWKRAIASQMSDAQLERTIAKIAISTNAEELVSRGEVIKFDGFLKVYLETKEELEDENPLEAAMLPPLSINQILNLREILATQRFSRAAPRYNEASLVQKLEELGIGRPSTYAPTIKTIQERGYVLKTDREGTERKFTVLTLKNNTLSEELKTETTGTEKSKLFPEDIGMLVNDYLVTNFPNILDYQFTASVEGDFDRIAQGQLKWRTMLHDFYFPFHTQVEKSSKESERVSGERILGEDPKTGKQVSVRMGKFGALAQLTNLADSQEKPRFTSLLKHQKLELITLQDALELFNLPRQLGIFEDKPVEANIGKFGAYVKFDGGFVSIPKELDLYTISLVQAIETIENKRQADANKLIKSFAENKEVQVLNGRYGAYIAVGKQNVKIPKDKAPETLTLEECLELSANQVDKPKKPFKKFVKK